MSGTKHWAAVGLIVLILYYLGLSLTLTYGAAAADSLGVTMNGNFTTDVNISTTFGQQSTCDFPRYRYNTQGEATRYVFDRDNLDCELSIGAVSEGACNSFNGCGWINVTSGFWWFTETSQICNGTINKTYYNGGTPTTEEICLIDGLQGDANTDTCRVLGCTVREPKLDAKGGVNSPVAILDTVGDLFLLRYDFAIENAFGNVMLNLVLFYFPFLFLILCVYLLAPLIH